MKIYTKGGDKGETSLLGGERVSKYDLRVHTYGEVDELNSFIGLAASYCDEHQILFKEIQSALFNIGAILACPDDKREEMQLMGIPLGLVERLEQEIDSMTSQLDELRSFILPGGHFAAAHLHVARSVTRRVERNLVNFVEQSQDDSLEDLIMFINRLSDFFFVMGRYYNKKNGVDDIPWNA